MSAIKSLFIAPSENDRRNNINAIRFIAAAMVIYGHMAHLTGHPVPLLFGEEVSSVAVKVFFVLSGYLIMQSYERDSNLFRYLIRRIFRIFPGLIFVCFLSALIIGPILSSLSVRDYFSEPSTYLYFLKNILMNPVYALPGVFQENIYPNAVNGSLWTLPVEFLMYLLLPPCVIIFKKTKYPQIGLLLVGAVLEAIEIVHITVFPNWAFVIWGTNVFDGLALAPYFFAGTFFTSIKAKNSLRLQWAVVLAFFAGIAVWGNYWKYEIVLFAVLPYITLACSFASPAVFGRVFAVNDYSYGLYLWGFLIQQIFVQVLGPEILSIVLYSLICFVVATLCAMASWFLIEKPRSKVGKRITTWSRVRGQKQ